MSAGIKVSPKHGVNPTIPICFWCGEEKGEIALLGKLPGDAEAPRNMVLDYEPSGRTKMAVLKPKRVFIRPAGLWSSRRTWL